MKENKDVHVPTQKKDYVIATLNSLLHPNCMIRTECSSYCTCLHISVIMIQPPGSRCLETRAKSQESLIQEIGGV